MPSFARADVTLRRLRPAAAPPARSPRAACAAAAQHAACDGTAAAAPPSEPRCADAAAGGDDDDEAGWPPCCDGDGDGGEFALQLPPREELPLPGVRLVREAAASGAEARAARRARLNAGADLDSSSEETGDDVYERHFAALRRQGFFQRCPEDPYQARSMVASIVVAPLLDADASAAAAQGVLRRSARRARPAAGFGEESEEEEEGAASQRRGNWCAWPMMRRILDASEL